MEPGRIPKELELTKGSLAENWRAWKADFDFYLQGLGKDSADTADSCKIGLFMNVAGREAQDVFTTFELNADNRKKYEEVVKAFKNHCNPRKRVLFERHVFTSTRQEGDDDGNGETIDQYLTKLKKLVKSCDYKEAMVKEMLRDVFVFGLRDNGPGGLMERLFREENVSLERAVEMARASEASKQQMKILRKSEKNREAEVKFVKKKTFQKKKSAPQESHSSKEYKCKKCARTHMPRSCPAYGKKCKACGERNHFEICCSNKKETSKKFSRHHRRVREIEEEADTDSDEFYIGLLSVNTKNGSDWMETLGSGVHKFQVKLDTGAQCNVLNERLYSKITDEPLEKSRVRLVTFSKEVLKPLGQKKLPITCKGKKQEVMFQIVKGKLPPILGCDDCCKLGLIRRVDAVE